MQRIGLATRAMIVLLVALTCFPALLAFVEVGTFENMVNPIDTDGDGIPDAVDVDLDSALDLPALVVAPLDSEEEFRPDLREDFLSSLADESREPLAIARASIIGEHPPRAPSRPFLSSAKYQDQRTMEDCIGWMPLRKMLSSVADSSTRSWRSGDVGKNSSSESATRSTHITTANVPA